MKKTKMPSSKKTSKNLKTRVAQSPVPAGRGSSAVRNGASRKNSTSSNNSKTSRNGASSRQVAKNPHGIPDWRLERPDFTTAEVKKNGNVHYEVQRNLRAPAPPIRDSKYLKPEQCVELYRWMLLNRKMEQTLETLYKQSKVVGGVYFGLGQESCS